MHTTITVAFFVRRQSQTEWFGPLSVEHPLLEILSFIKPVNPDLPAVGQVVSHDFRAC